MRIALLICVVASVSACAGSPASPTGAAGGTAVDIAGTWNGTMVSSNNATQQLKMVLTQSGSAISGTWDSSSVSWAGDITGAVNGSSFDGQFKFSGKVSDGTVCTGTANVVGPAAGSTMTWTSVGGVVGGSCPAPLPIGLQIAVQRQ